MRPPEKVQRGFAATIKIRLAEPDLNLRDEELTGWFIANNQLLTVAHALAKNLFGSGVNETKTIFRDQNDKEWAGSITTIKNRQDLALFSVEGAPAISTLSLRTEPPRKHELVWWYCKAGILENQWSLAKFLKEVPETDNMPPTYLFTVIVGGAERGCSGAPIFGANGRIIGWVRGQYNQTDYSRYFPYSPADQVAIPDGPKIIRAGRSIDIEDTFHLLFQNQRGADEQETRMLPSWMLPPHRVEQNFAGVIEVEINDNAPRPPRGSMWRIDKHVYVTAAHFYSRSRLDTNSLAKINIAGKTHTGIILMRNVDADLAYFFIAEETGLPILPLREESPKKNELLWWYCATGLLTDEWSMGRFLGEVPPKEALAGKYANNMYLVNTMLGGVHAGCSGAPVMDYEGQVVGLVNGFMAGGSFENILAVRSEDIKRALQQIELERMTQ